MAEYKLIFVNKKPFRVWPSASTYRDQDLILGLQPDLHLRIAQNLANSLSDEDNSHAVLGLRLLYGLSLEAFFALLFAMLQAPEAPSAWLLLYRSEDLEELIERFQAGADLPSRILCPEPGSWEALALMLFPISCVEHSNARTRIKRLGSLWREWAAELLDKDMRAEFYSLKHGARIRSAAPYLSINDLQIEGSEHGSWFATCEKSKSDVLLGTCARSWSGWTLYSRLKLMASSHRNLVEILRIAHKAGDTSRSVIELPEHTELDAATSSGKPLVGLRIGASWEKGRQAVPLTYEEAIVEYKRFSGTLTFGGEFVESSVRQDDEPGCDPAETGMPPA